MEWAIPIKVKAMLVLPRDRKVLLIKIWLV